MYLQCRGKLFLYPIRVELYRPPEDFHASRRAPARLLGSSNEREP
jgi:hypothetical protein